MFPITFQSPRVVLGGVVEIPLVRADLKVIEVTLGTHVIEVSRVGSLHDKARARKCRCV